jgi:hypothetical protein
VSRAATLIESIGVGSVHVGIKDLNGSERRAIFQFVSPNPFLAEIFATQDFDFVTNVGTNWTEVTGRVFLGVGDGDELDFIDVGGSLQRKKTSQGAISIGAEGMYALDDGFMPAAFSVNVTSITSGSPVKILFGV